MIDEIILIILATDEARPISRGTKTTLATQNRHQAATAGQVITVGVDVMHAYRPLAKEDGVSPIIYHPFCIFFVSGCGAPNT